MNKNNLSSLLILVALIGCQKKQDSNISSAGQSASGVTPSGGACTVPTMASKFAGIVKGQCGDYRINDSSIQRYYNAIRANQLDQSGLIERDILLLDSWSERIPALTAEALLCIANQICGKYP
jgi:hypothetical protein